ncbi:helix-turn-helix domain-containing protein [Flavobacterium terrisoli]|uniref:helix-turn-helix domain-containing protein n=1 Tax=Flavobacterium terrisoli TaxID=3242195 RepID=UPI002542A096|nr:helix-turn-helix transcriptional regulator [Flavobacterium buctense]
MEIGIKIKRLRESKKISQMELSTILGISQTKLCHIESSEDKSIDFILMNKVCHYFDVGFNYFLEEKPESNYLKINQREPIICIDFENNFPESIIAQINFLITDNKQKERQINDLLSKIAELENKKK